MVRRIDLTGADGVHLAAWEFADPPGGPDGDGAAPLRNVLFLHGLTGRASHWADTARRLSDRCRAVALDQRGHGHSGEPAGPPVPGAYVADAAAAVERLGLAPVTLVGHGAGALTAWQLAAERPELVEALVIAEMRASAPGAASQREWEEWLRAWPVPFATLADVRKWFGEDDPWTERPNPARGAFFAEAMREAPDGWRPVCPPERILAARSTWAYDAHWDTLARVRCPTLVVRGLDGELGRAEAHEMVRVLPRGRYAEVPDAGHHLHYEQPETWYGILRSFLTETA